MAEIDETLTPNAVHASRARACKKERLNTIYKILKNVKGRDNAIHACEIIARARDTYGVEGITTNDITECVNKLVEMGWMTNIMSVKKIGYYRAEDITDFKLGLYEIAMVVKGYMNRWDKYHEAFCAIHGMGLIPDDPFDYKQEVAEELSETL